MASLAAIRPVLDDWHVIARSEDIVEGSLSTAKVLNQDLLAWRKDGVLNVWKDACIHRGAPLSKGHLCARGIRCPYHGWEFASGGECVYIPAQGDRPVPQNARAVCFPAADRYGWAWVNLSRSEAALPSYDEFDSRAHPAIMCGPYSLKAWGPRVIENFLDVSHLPFVHGGILGSVDDSYVEDYQAAIENGVITADPVHVLQPNPDGSGEKTTVLYAYKVLKPLAAQFTKRFDGRTFSIMLAVTPVADGESMAWMRIAVDYPVGPAEEMVAFQDALLEQDRSVLEYQRPPRLPLDLKSEFHLVSDRLSVTYRQWLRQLNMEYGVE